MNEGSKRKAPPPPKNPFSPSDDYHRKSGWLKETLKSILKEWFIECLAQDERFRAKVKYLLDD